MTPADVAGLRGALAAARSEIDAKRRNPALASQIDGLARGLKAPASADAATSGREAALRKTLSGIIAQLR